MKERKFIVEFEGKYLVKVPSWSAGIWTKNKNEAAVFGESSGLGYFPKYFPQFTVIEIMEKPNDPTR